MSLNDDAAVEAARHLRSLVSRLRRRLRDEQDDEGLTPSQSTVLSDLDREGPATVSELAALEKIRPQSMALTVGVLVDLGLVRAGPDPEDGRRKLLSPTTLGREHLEARRTAKQDWLVRRLREELDDDELDVVARGLALVQRVTQ
ncbi:MarR family winged helix-turn-helix transcriptional regulator [Nocardioides acrostichi]|uniref:MarR family winged helix-turn-helix transcriptional regulator n=1 Tax=Nocardioides acrostichi TaxID=2784339 RepID=UPI001A9C78E7|nr:MarR family transcriptional regulator [Nocardioides acrostichi]